MIQISLQPDEHKARVVPAAFLGEQRFDRFRKLCDAAGARYSRREKVTLVELGMVGQLQHSLAHAGFVVSIDPGLVDKLKGMEQVAKEKMVAAVARLEAAIEDGLKPFPFQETGIAKLAIEHSFILGDDMGLGKTIQALLASPANAPVVIVCPQKPKRNWAKESARWRPDLAHNGSCKHDEAGRLVSGDCGAILNGRGSFRWAFPGTIVITNYELLPASTAEAKDAIKKAEDKGNADLVMLEKEALRRTEAFLANVPEGTTIIFDEAHRLSNKKSQRTRRAVDLIKTVLDRGGHAWGLTGSPLRNRPDELASLLSTFKLFNKAFGTWPRFLSLMSGKPLFWGGYEWGTPRPEAIECIRKVMLRREFAEVFKEMPAKIYQDIEVDIDKATEKACVEARAALAAAGITLEEAISGAANIDTVQQVAHARKLLAMAKLPTAIEIAEEYEEQGQPVIFFSAHRAPIEALAAREGWAAIMGGVDEKTAGETVERFQAGNLRGLGIVIRAGGESLTLTRAHHAVFIDLEWTPTANLQAEARIYRLGQTRGVIIKRLVAPKTIDEDVTFILSEKSKMISNIISASAVSGSAS